MTFRPIVMHVSLFANDRDKRDVRRSRKAMLWLLEALTQINVAEIKMFDPVEMYESEVIYQPENNTENWQDVLNILANGFGDCEDLACWRAAELRVIGIHARPYLIWKDSSDKDYRQRGARFHAVVKLPDGRVEDPSLALGMGGAPITRRPEYIPV